MFGKPLDNGRPSLVVDSAADPDSPFGIARVSEVFRALGSVRRIVAILFRSAVVTLIVLRFAELQMVRRSDRLTTMFLIDGSQSVPRELQGPAGLHHGRVAEARTDDLTGSSFSASPPSVESPRPDRDQPARHRKRQSIPSTRDLASAIKLALATFPEDTARRIVILSDGNGNRGNAIEQALSAKKLGVQVDTVPLRVSLRPRSPRREGGDPPDVKKGETVSASTWSFERVSRPGGRCRSSRRRITTAAPRPPGMRLPQPVEAATRDQRLQPETARLPSRTSTRSPPRFVLEKKGAATAGRSTTSRKVSPTHAANAQVLLIEGTAGEHVELVRALREKEIAVTTLVAPRIEGSGGSVAIPCRPTWLSSSRMTR